MSTFTSNKDEEINYWPSVSDMFLVFFIMALCIVSTMYSSYSDGEKEIMDEVVYQSNVLFETCKKPRYEKQKDADDETNRPQLAKLLMSSAQWIKNQGGAVNAIEEPAGSDDEYKNYRQAVLYLIRLVGDESEIEKAEVTDSARLLDFVNAHVSGKQLFAKVAQGYNKTDARAQVELDVLDEVIYQANLLSQSLRLRDVYSRDCEYTAARPKLAAQLMKIDDILYISKPYTADYRLKYTRYSSSPQERKNACSDYLLAVDWLYRGVVSPQEYLKKNKLLDCGRKLDVVHAKINDSSLFEQMKRKNEDLEDKNKDLERENQRLSYENRKLNTDKQELNNLIAKQNEHIVVLEKDSRVSRVVMDGKDLQFYGNSVAVLRYPPSASKQAIQELCHLLAESLKENDESKIKRQVVEIIGHTDSSSSGKSFADFFTDLKEDEYAVTENYWFDQQNLPGLEDRVSTAQDIAASLNEKFTTKDMLEAVGSGNAALGLARAIRYEEEIKSAILKRLSEGATFKDLAEYKRRLNSGKYLQFRCYSAAQLYPEDQNNSTAHENRRIELLVRKMQDSEIPE